MASQSPKAFSDAEIEEYRQHFASFDANNDQFIDDRELAGVMKNLGLYESQAQVQKLMKEVDQNQNGVIEFGEFLDIIYNIKQGKTSGFAQVYTKQKDLIQVKGHTGVHAYAEEEVSAFAEHLNIYLQGDKDVAHLLPINPQGLDLAKKVRDGILLAKFINVAVPDTIDMRAVNLRKNDKDISLFQINENQTLVIASAKAIGVKVTNVGAGELVEGEKFPHLVLGLVWQLVKVHLLNSINLRNHPELIRLLNDGETLADLLKLPPDQLLLRWFNYHLKNAGHPKRVSNFSGDVKDSEAYTVLLHQISPAVCDKSALAQSNPTDRATAVLANARKLEVKAPIKARDIVSGNPRLNLIFTAQIFNTCPGLDPLSQEEIDKAGLMEDDVGDSREERAFRMWINSLALDDGAGGSIYINNLFEDCADGLVLLRVMDHISPGIVTWKSVEKNPSNKFKKVSNCNYVVVLGKQLKFSLVNIAGNDIVGGNKKLILALVWQMMRCHTLKFLAEVQAKKFGGKEVKDEDLIAWANEKVASQGRSSTMASFKDKSLSNGIFFMDLLYAIEPRIIDFDFVKEGLNDEEKLLNAKYAISVARKLGAVIFLLPEDIVEVKPKMILTFIASIMAIEK